MKPSELDNKLQEIYQYAENLSMWESTILAECKKLGILDLMNQLGTDSSNSSSSANAANTSEEYDRLLTEQILKEDE
jgi:hypothetical protein